MRHWRSIVVAAFAALLVPASGLGSAGGPPWETDTYSDCPPPNSQLISQCTHSESSNGQTGDGALDLFLTSRGQGYLPGAGSSYSDIVFRLPNVAVPVATTAIVVKATLLVRSASVATTGRLGGRLTTATGAIESRLYARTNTCEFSYYYECASDSIEMITSSATMPVQNEPFEMIVKLRPPQGESLPAGSVLMEFTLRAYGSLGPAYTVGTGSIHGTADIKFTGFQVSYTAA